MPPASNTNLAQITTSGKERQAESRPITILDVLRLHPDGSPRVASDREEFHKLHLEFVQPAETPVRGAYFHVPFCFHKCHYCDFYSIVDSHDRQEEFVDRLIEELRAASAL